MSNQYGYEQRYLQNFEKELIDNHKRREWRNSELHRTNLGAALRQNDIDVQINRAAARGAEQAWIDNRAYETTRQQRMAMNDQTWNIISWVYWVFLIVAGLYVAKRIIKG